MSKSRCFAPIALGVFFVVAQAKGQPQDAREAEVFALYAAARAAVAQGNLNDGRAHLERAYAKLEVPTLAVALARVAWRGGDWLGAQRWYQVALELPEGPAWRGERQSGAKDAARRELLLLEGELPVVVVELAAPMRALRITLDSQELVLSEKRVELHVNPGTHTLRVSSGNETTVQQVVGKPGSRTHITLRVEQKGRQVPPPAVIEPRDDEPLDKKPRVIDLRDQKPQSSTSSPKASPWPTLGWMSTVVGGAALVTGTVTGLVVLSKHEEYSELCPNAQCRRGAIDQDDVNNYNTLRTVSTSTLIAGSVLTAVGITILVSGPSESAPRAVSLRLAPNGLLLGGEL